jgi:lipid II:glycine glycyltransferase (peptidoglycan interpeptide bridge formation enzyme)
MLAADHGFIATAIWNEKPVAAAVFLHQGAEAVYKFGASDYSFQHLRANNLLMWEAINRYALSGLNRLHLGRTALSHNGLRRFKLGFGSREHKIEYAKYDYARESFVTSIDYCDSRLTGLFRRMPLWGLRILGQVLYPYFA